MKCPRCSSTMRIEESPMERRPDHLDMAGRHRWIREYHCRTCGNREHPSYKEPKHEKKSTGETRGRQASPFR